MYKSAFEVRSRTMYCTILSIFKNMCPHLLFHPLSLKPDRVTSMMVSNRVLVAAIPDLDVL